MLSPNNKPWIIDSGGYSSNSHNLIQMVPSQVNSRLGFINPGLTLSTMTGWWYTHPSEK